MLKIQIFEIFKKSKMLRRSQNNCLQIFKIRYNKNIKYETQNEEYLNEIYSRRIDKSFKEN